jgi:putative membrane protein
MSADTVIREASFDPRVKTYWLLSGALIFVLTIVGIPLLLLWFPLGLVFTGRYLDRMSCTLTSKNLKVKKGVLVRVEKTIPLDKITDMALVEGPLMRSMDIQRLSVETAGQSGAGALVSLTGIVLAEEFREAVLEQRDALTKQGREAGSGDGGPAANASNDLAALTESVRRIERLLEARLASKG